MIKSFRCADTQRLFEGKTVPKFRPFMRVAQRKLLMLDAATSYMDLKSPPGNRPEKLKGNRAGQHSIRINDQYRICFKWQNNHAYQVEIVDYHKG